MSSLRRSATTLLVMVALLAVASGCRVVGSGTLELLDRPANLSAARSGSPMTVEVFRPDPGDAWPPEGQLGLKLHAENIPDFHMFCEEPWMNCAGVTGRLYLLLTPPSVRGCDPPPYDVITGAPDLVSHRDSTSGTGKGLGPIVLTADRVLNAFLAIDDTPENRQATWWLTSEPWPNGGAYALRCGTITVARP
jgi:hypothetical protein